MRVKEVCKEKGVTISQLAEKIGIKQESLSRAINDNPTLGTLEKIAVALDVPVTKLFTDEGIIGVIRAHGQTFKINSLNDIKNAYESIKLL